MADAGSANSSEVVMEQIPAFLSGVLCPQIELPENFNVSGNGNVTAYKHNSSEVAMEQMSGFQSGVLCPQIELLKKFYVSRNEASEDMHSHGLNYLISGRRLGRISKKKKCRMKILHETRLQLTQDSGEIVNFETSTDSTSDDSNLSIASEKVDFGSDTTRPFCSDRKMENTSLNILCASLHLSDDVSTECPAKDADCASQLGTDEVTVHAGGSCLYNIRLCKPRMFDKGSSVDDKVANLLATDISSVKEADVPGAADNSEAKCSLKEGPSVDEDSHLDAVDFSGDGLFPGNMKKRKIFIPRLNFSSFLVDDSVGDCLTSEDLKLDQVPLRLAEQDADRSEETISAMHLASTDGSENFSVPEMDDTLAYGYTNVHVNDDLAFIGNTLSTCANGSDDREINLVMNWWHLVLIFHPASVLPKIYFLTQTSIQKVK